VIVGYETLIGSAGRGAKTLVSEVQRRLILCATAETPKRGSDTPTQITLSSRYNARFAHPSPIGNHRAGEITPPQASV
jgi:hypothetical protein